jgi:hypothetical protein
MNSRAFPPERIRARSIMWIASMVKCERSHCKFYVIFNAYDDWEGGRWWAMATLFGFERVGAVPVVGGGVTWNVRIRSE